CMQAYKEAEIWQDFNKFIEGSMPNPLKTEITVDNLVYECYIDEAKVVGYVGEPVDVIIPETITSDGKTYYTVTAIKDNCFNTCSTLKSLEMPNSVSEIGYYCFNSCENLESVKLSPNITDLPYGLFSYCSNLKEFEITPNIKRIGDGALYGTGISKMFIPKTFIPDPYSRPFGRNTNLEKFEVEEGHEYYKEIDGILYRIAGDGLILESVPGAKSGVVVIASECTELFRESFCGVQNVTDLILNEGLQTINQYAVSGNDHLQHISIPTGVTIHEHAFYDNIELESVTFRGNPITFSNIFAYSPSLKYIYVPAEEESVNLDGLFSDEYENLELYNSSIDKKFEYSGAHTVYIPGACMDRYSKTDDVDVVEMWSYRINRGNNCIAILPVAEGIEIKAVTINGRIATGENNIYKIVDDAAKIESEADPYSDLDVKVEYVLRGRHVMLTHYSPEFNAAIPDAD
ncbi:MAG: leucine-rich repeat domain-containing protein, partial [Muribaculaceae bacterium]|nr:leucine-rich repeat domain-containing protein [Muribaculaceae bacterium]